MNFQPSQSGITPRKPKPKLRTKKRMHKTSVKIKVLKGVNNLSCPASAK
jgi:hypothetical protein